TLIEIINEENDGRRSGIITELREIENYIPKSLVEEEFDIELPISNEEWQTIDVPKYLRNHVMLHIPNNKREMVIKQRLNGSVSKKITAKLLKEGNNFDEIESWFKNIKTIYES